MKVLDISQAAAFLKMHRVTLTKKAKAGLIPCAKPAKKWLFYESHLIEFLKGNHTQQEGTAGLSVASKEKLAQPSKKAYLKALGMSDCPQIHSPQPDALRGARHARAANRVAESKAVGLVVNSRPCHNRPADDVRA